jgi:hypothetical protein
MFDFANPAILRITLLPTLLAMLLPIGCSSTDFQGDVSEKSSKKEKNSKNDNQRRVEELKDISQENEEDDDEKVSEPAEIAGAFLACITMEDSRSSATTFSCSLTNANQKLSLPKDSISIEAFDEHNNTLQIYMSSEDFGSSPWHTVFNTVSEVSGVVATVNLQGQKSQFLWKNDESFSLNSELGKSFDFHVGDGDYSGSTCKKDLNSRESLGDLVKITIELLQDAEVEINLNEICGIDYANSNSISLVADNGVDVFSNTIEVGSTRYSNNTFLKAGKYELVIMAHEVSGNNGVDDFIIGGVSVLADEAVSLSY